MAEYRLYNQDNMTTMEQLKDNSLDAIVTDAPYGLGKEPNAEQLIKAWLEKGYLEIKGKGFMGKEWDAFVPQPAFWKLAYKKLKPGGYVLCFFGTRTYDWGVLAMRLAGFEIRDCIQWIYGSGFPKSLDVSKAIDKMGEYNKDYSQLSKELCDYLKASREAKGMSKTQLGEYFKTHPDRINHGGCITNWEQGYNLPTISQWEILKKILKLKDDRFVDLIERAILKRIEAEREVVGHIDATLLAVAPGQNNDRSQTSIEVTAPATEQAKTWSGYGTALKPAYEPICVARKPLDGTVAENVLKHKCGAINLDGCRIPFLSEQDKQSAVFGTGVDITGGNYNGDSKKNDQVNIQPSDKGRFPSNIILDEQSAMLMDKQTGPLTSGKMAAGTLRHNQNGYAGPMPLTTGSETYGDSGGASRFFYCAKASRADRDYGCEGMEYKEGGLKSNTSGQHITRRDGFVPSPLRNNHPTVKPINLMRYLVRLVKTPIDACTILDPFMGSGTTGIACMLEGINFIGIEMENESYDIAVTRIEYAKKEYLKEQAKPKQTSLF